MPTWIALFRGINVGGNHLVPMKQLVTLLEAQGCRDVKTYIQSGNVVFRSPVADAARVERAISAAVAKQHGFEPRVLALGPRELERVVKGNPFSEADAAPKTVHVYFLAAAPRPSAAKALDELKTPTERYLLKGKVAYLHTPDGFGTSKLAARLERLLGVEATARNWRTVTALLELARSYEEANAPG